MNRKSVSILSVICILTIAFTCFWNYSAVVNADINKPGPGKHEVKFDTNGVKRKLKNNSETFKKADLDKINSDMLFLNELGILESSEEQIKEISIDKKNKINYSVELGKYENTISVENKSGRTEMTAQQGDISNTLTVYDDGRIYLDGKLVINKAENRKPADITMYAEGLFNANFMNNLKSASDVVTYDYWSSSPLHGKTGDYKYHWKNESVKNLDLGKAIKNITVSVFITVLLLVIGAKYVVSIGVAVFTGVYDYFKVNDPTSGYLSYKASVYTIKKGTPSVSASVGSVYKYNFQFFGGKNYTNHQCNKTYYRQLVVR